MRRRLGAQLGTTLLAISFATGPLQSASDPGGKIAARHVRFARLLATSHVRFSSPQLEPVATEIEHHDCKMTAAAEKLAPGDLLPLARAYASEYCRPWVKLWDGVMDRCLEERPPQWCDDEQALIERLGFNGYFQSLTEALQSPPDELERENIMDMILATFSAHVIGDFGKELPDRWATDAAKAYLPAASFDQVIAMAERLQKSWVGLTPGVMSQLQQYLQRTVELTAEQRGSHEAVLATRFADD